MSFNLGDMKTLIQEGINRIDANPWSYCCRHVRDREAEYWKADIAVEQEIEKIVIQIDSDSDVSSSEDDNASEEGETTDTAGEEGETTDTAGEEGETTDTAGEEGETTDTAGEEGETTDTADEFIS